MAIHIRISTCFLGFLLCAASANAIAFTTALPDRFTFSIGVAPRVSSVGAPRTLFANGCTGSVTLDESAVSTTGTLVLRSVPESIGCVESTRVLSYTPRNVGTLRVIMKMPDDSTAAEASLETVAGARSTVNLDGMWFDPATNGSGISFHHSAATDGVFGTWFMYGSGTRWYSLQSMQWTNARTLTGIAYEAKASNLQALCAMGSECPRVATDLKPIGTVGVSVIDNDNLRIEAFDQYGRTAFISFLKRLAF